MTILAARFLPGFRTRILLLGTCVLFAGSAQVARADFLSSRIEGTQFWMPPGVQGPEPIASLHSPVRGGLLRIKSTRIRDEAELDLLGGRMVVYRRYGSVDMAPVWVEDLRTMIGAAAVHSAREVWMDVLRRETSARRGDQHAGLISIDIPVEFPDALADIIGQGARLNLTGSERITFSGTSNIIEGGPTYESGNPSAFPDLDMKQHLKLNLDGTIGRKIHVLVNHDSEVSTDLDNKIQLRYDGDEDEIVQKIEMGNTDLSLPGSEFLSFRKSQQGLFGAKAQGSLGPLNLTVIASKQEGKTASQTFVGRARRDSVTVRDIDYIKRQYFWIDTPEVLAMNSDPGDGAAVLPLGGEGFDLFMDDRDAQNNFTNTFIANAWIDVVDTTSANFTGFFTRLEENVDYQVDRQSGNVVLTRPLDDRYALAAHYVRASGDSVGALSVAEGDTISLKLLRPPQSELDDDAKGFVRARAYEQKNIYFLGARNIVPEGFELVIRRKGATAGEPDEDIQIDEANAANNQEFVRIMGLDYRGLADDIPDLRVEPEFVDYEAGTITFPNITPFAPDSSSINVIVSPSQVSTGRSSEPGVPLAEDNGALYSLPPDELYNQDRYYIETKYTTPTPTYSLNRFNILEGSERVHLNGRLLNRGSDYDIDYDYGILTFRTADASLPDAEISVDFEFVPLFGQAKESLLGLSGTYNFGPRTHLSSSLLFFTKATPEERPKLGQEPTRTFVGNLYGQWVKEPDFLTSLANAIPLVRTDAKSDVQLQGEVAFSMPNPNTKNQIYIDDMEGVEDSRELSLARGTWHPASEPVGMEYLPRTVFNWYNPENVVRRKDVYPQVADEREGQDFIQILEFRTRETASPDSSWVGIMRNLSMTGEDYTEKKFVEIWVDDLGGYEGVMTFDIGEISEDHYLESEGLQKGRGFLDTEDFDPFDGSLTVSREDLGLDNVQGTDGSGSEGDDGDDDFFFERTSTPDYTQINGTEGNSRLDTEDTDGDNFLDTDNKYLSFEIDLSDTLGSPYLVQRNSEVTGEADNYWRLYRIPIDDGVPVGGVVRRKAVKYARLWFEGLSEDAGVKARVASIKIVGAAWVEEAMATNDTVEPVPESEDAGSFLINVKNTKEDDDYFPPFDPGKDQSNEEKREQSLVVQYSEIPSGSVTEGRQGSAYKEILDTGDGTSTNFTQYETMSFYLRDGARDRAGAVRPGFDPVEGSTGTFFFRFGADTLNFYEFATVPDSSWQEVNIPLDELAVLKLDAPETTLTVEGAVVEYREMIVDGDTLSVYGAPSLTRVRRMTVGVRGDDPARPEVSGEVWFDEIRLRSVKKKRGAAARLHGSARVADLLTLDGGIRRVGSEFRRIEGERHGSDEFSWNARGDLKLNKFIDGRGLSFPISGSYDFSESVPLLSPNSDIELISDEDKMNARTVRRKSSFSARIAKTRQSSNPFIHYTLDNLSLSYARTNSRNRTPFLASRGHTATGQTTYNLTPGRARSIRLLKTFDFNYFPTLKLGINGSLNGTESSDIRQGATGNAVYSPRAPVRNRLLEGSLGFQWDPLRSNSFDSQFAFNKRQDLDLRKDLSLVESFQAGGRELRRDHNMRVSWRPGFVRWLRPVMSYDSNYQEDQGPGAQAADTELRLRRVQNASTREISSSLNLRQLFRSKGGGSPSGGSTGRRRPVSGSGKETGDEEAGEEEQGDPAWKQVLNGARGVARMVGDIRYSYSDRRSSRFSRVGASPGLGYQMGLSEFDSGLLVLPEIGGASLIEDNTDRSRSSKLDTSFSPTSNIVTNWHYTKRTTRKVLNATRTRTEDVTFPDVALSIDGLEKRFFLQRWARSSNLSSSFRRESKRSGRISDEAAPLPEGTKWYDSDATRSDFTPLVSWSTNWKGGVNTTLTVNRGVALDESEFNSVVSSTRTTNNAFRMNARYSFSAPRGLSLFGGKRLRFRSDLTLNFDFDRSEDKVEETQTQPDGEATTTVRSHRKSLGIKPRATYNFSRKIQGSLDLSYSRTEDLLRDRTDTSISVAVEALIKF